MLIQSAGTSAKSSLRQPTRAVSPRSVHFKGSSKEEALQQLQERLKKEEQPLYYVINENGNIVAFNGHVPQLSIPSEGNFQDWTFIFNQPTPEPRLIDAIVNSARDMGIGQVIVVTPENTLELIR